MNGPECNSAARLDGKVTIITGANAGLGKATALDFFNRGMSVLYWCSFTPYLCR